VQELVRTNDPVLVSAIEALLNGAGIPHLVLDQNMSVMEGSLGILPRRVLVPDDRIAGARKLMREAGLGHELRTDPGERSADAFTDDAVLGGRVRLRQPRRGHRAGHDAILLAAATAAYAGEHAVELGAGVGTAGLALAWRVGGLRVTLVEIDPLLSELAAGNVAANGFTDRVDVVTLDAAGPPQAFADAGLPPGCAHVVLMNPPFNDPAQSQASPESGRVRAHAGTAATLQSWVTTAARLLIDHGALTLIWRADGLADVLNALDGLGGIAVMPVHARAESPAIRILLHATKGSRAPLQLLPALVLNDAHGRPSAAANAVLRDAATLPLASKE
jgi:tRNA1(Val) A37 N6-methylase TrmN6